MGEGFRFTPENERPQPVFGDVERGPEPEAKLGPESAKFASLSEPQTQAETYDPAYWTRDKISSAVSSFFEMLKHNEQRMIDERQRLLEQALEEKKAREVAEKAIAKRGMVEAEEQRRERFRKELEETEAQRQFRQTIEWMIEQSHDQIQNLAINFLQSTEIQDQTQDKD